MSYTPVGTCYYCGEDVYPGEELWERGKLVCRYCYENDGETWEEE